MVENTRRSRLNAEGREPAETVNDVPLPENRNVSQERARVERRNRKKAEKEVKIRIRRS